jgi:outer membrane protein assembly factor BamB
LRFWLPWIVIGLSVVLAVILWSWPAHNPHLQRGPRTLASIGLVILTILSISIWAVFFSGWSWWLRLGTLALPFVLMGACWSALTVRFSGDMVPLVQFGWTADQDESLEAHRREHEKPAYPGSVDLKQVLPSDFPEYRGRRRDGIVTGPALARNWADPPPCLWRQPVGGGYSSFAVVGDIAITLEQRRDQESVVCYDATTGRERWLYAYTARFSEKLGGIGPRATPTIAESDVFSLGATGTLVCLEADSGQLKWSVNILKDNKNISWGMSGSPLVYDQIVVVNPGAQVPSAAGKALVAYDRNTGKPVWSSASTHAGYSSPMLATLAGKRQILLFDGEGVGGYDATSGQELWRFPWQTYTEINVAQPIVLDDDQVFISSGYGTGCALLKVSHHDGRWSVEAVWRKKTMQSKFANPVAYRGYIYGLNDGTLGCIDQRTGERKWRGERYGHGQLLLAGDLLVILSEWGEIVLVEASPEGPREVAKFQAIEGKTWNYPALANGKIYVRNDMEMACYDLAGTHSATR